MSPRFPRSLLASAVIVAAIQPAFAVTPQDKYFADQWAMEYGAAKPSVCTTLDGSGNCTGALSGTYDSDMNVPQGWDYFASSGQEVVIALMDTGIDTNHPDLKSHLWKNAGELNANGQCDNDRVDNDGNGYVDDCYGINAISGTGLSDQNQNDTVGHGTQMAGSMVAAVNNLADPQQGGVVGVAGLAPNVKVVTCGAWELKALSDISTVPQSSPVVAGVPADMLECASYFNRLKDRGVNIVVVNISGGVSRAINGGGLVTPVMKDEYLVNRDDVRAAMEALKQRDILVVTAAGNLGWDVDNQINTQIALSDRAYYPAAFDYDHIIAVTATDINAKLWAVSGQPLGSSWGRYTVDVAAPGDNLLTTLPLVQANTGYGFTGMTSPATAYVTGLVAMIKANSATAHYSGAQVRRLVISSGKKFEPLANTSSSGKLVRLDGALNCLGSIHRRRQLPQTDSVVIAQGGQLRMEVQNYQCANSAGVASMPVRDTLTNTTLFSLTDNGQGADRVAGDGIYSASWTVPSASTSYKLSYGTDSVTGRADVLTVNPKSVVVDNGLSFINWISHTASAPYYGGHYNYYAASNQAAYKWSFNIATAGRYKVYATWPIEQNHGGFANNAQYVISDASGSKVVAKDQRSGGGAWMELGTFNFNAGSNSVTVKNSQHTDSTTDTETLISSGALIADAIRVVQDF